MADRDLVAGRVPRRARQAPDDQHRAAAVPDRRSRRPPRCGASTASRGEAQRQATLARLGARCWALRPRGSATRARRGSRGTRRFRPRGARAGSASARTRTRRSCSIRSRCPSRARCLFVAGGALISFRQAWSMLLGAVVNYVVLAPIMLNAGIIDAPSFRQISAWSLWIGVPDDGDVGAAAVLHELEDGRARVQHDRCISPPAIRRRKTR